MENDKRYIDFITIESRKKEFDIWCKMYNITRERTELYYDFLVSLLNIIETTYLGADVIKEKDDIENHFSWCFNNVISNFEKEKIHFKSKGNYYDFLFLFFYDAFYVKNIKGDEIRIHSYFKTLFEFDYNKNNMELSMFTEFYKLFEQNLKK